MNNRTPISSNGAIPRQEQRSAGLLASRVAALGPFPDRSSGLAFGLAAYSCGRSRGFSPRSLLILANEEPTSGPYTGRASSQSGAISSRATRPHVDALAERVFMVAAFGDALMHTSFWRASLAVLAFTLIPAAALSQQTAPLPPAIPAPQDVAYPAGPITLDVDATDTARHIFNVHEVVPVAGGQTVTLLYPRWLPGNHSPSGPIFQMAGLEVWANGQRLEWRRDTADVYAFHIDVPAGANALDLKFQYLSPTAAPQGRITMTDAMLDLQWNAVVLYPAGYYASRIRITPSVKLPDGWTGYTALDGAQHDGATTHYAETALDVLVDSPMYAGRYTTQVDLDPRGPVPVHLDVVADRPDELKMSPAQIEAHRNLVTQAYRLYGAHHYNHYDFLFSLSDRMGGNGLEHHRSSEDGVGGDYFTSWDTYSSARDLLPHEYTHSWNGKYRRPFDLWTPNYNVPMQDTLLWVYEGQTQYWGFVLAARSGLHSRQQALDALALVAATYQARVGHDWRALQDTTNDPIIAQRRPQGWRSWQRSEDYYSEGQLIWLDADTLIRERTHGAKSLDDFAKTFFGVNNGTYNEDTYTFDDIVAALNHVMPYDWASFLRERLDQRGHAPLDGITRGGYRLTFTEERSAFQRDAESHSKSADFTYSIGLSLGEGGVITAVQWDGPAFNQGLFVGANVVAVNGDVYSADGLRRAITAARTGHDPIQLLVKNGDQYQTYAIDYHSGLRYPHLERVSGVPDRISQIFTARSR
jgi:predicted metalloprotease with PDZ domain